MYSNTSSSLISIALCTYNGEKYLKEQLESLVKQDYASLEIVVVDDGSTDKTKAIIEDFQREYAFIRYYENEDNLGYVGNFERAISYCQGDYITLCDQDDVWESSKLSVLHSKIQRGDSLIYHNSALTDERGQSLNKTLSESIGYLEGKEQHYALLLNNCIAGHAMMFRRGLLAKVLPIPPGIPHDHWIAYIAAKIGYVRYVREALVRYRQHARSMTSQLHLQPLKQQVDPFEEKLNKRIHINEERIRNLQALISFKGNSVEDQKFIEKLLQFLTDRDTKYFSLPMFLFLMKNESRIFQLYHRSWTSTLALVYKESIGNPLKMLMKNLK